MIEKLQKQLSQLWQLHSGKNNAARRTIMDDRATEVLREVNRRGWDNYRSLCEEAVNSTRQIWRESEALVNAAAEVDQTYEKALLCRCKRLLEAGDLLLASEEEILCLSDTGAECYGFAYENGELYWQQRLQ